MVRVCARSRRWWTQEIAENRKMLGCKNKSRKRGEASQQQVKTQRRNLRRIIRQSETEMRQDFWQSARRDQVWQVLMYTKPGAQQTVRTLRSRDGEVAESWERKAELIKEEAFPKPLKGVRKNISNNPSFHLKHQGVPDGSDGSGRTLYPLTENQTRPVAQATGRLAYLSCGGYYTMTLILATRRIVYYARRSGIRLPLLCVWNVVTYTHPRNDMYVTLFAVVAVMQ